MRASAPPAVGAIITTAAAAAAGRAVRPKQGPHGRACRLPPPELQFLGRTAVTYNMPACAQAGGTRGDPCGGVVFCGGGVFGFFAPLSVVHTDKFLGFHTRLRAPSMASPRGNSSARGCNCRVLIAPAVPPWFGADWTPPIGHVICILRSSPLRATSPKGCLRISEQPALEMLIWFFSPLACVHELTRTHCPS